MEKNQAITLALGAGALGTALAFFGYNYMNLQTNESSQIDNSRYNEVGNNTDVDGESHEMKEIKKEVSEEVKGAVDKKTAWAAFWGQEYNKNDKDSEGSKETTAESTE